MADMFKDAFQWITDTREAVHAQSMRFERDTDDEDVLSFETELATPGRTDNIAESQGFESGSMEAEVRSILIRANLYDFGAGPVEPENGDRIIWNSQTYRVMRDQGEQPWTWTDQYERSYRISVKQV